MTVQARVGLLRGHRVTVDGVTYAVRRERDGWYTVDGPTPAQSGRVRYFQWSDRIALDHPDGALEIRFRIRRTTLHWRGHEYRVGPMIWGIVSIREGTADAIRGRLTFAGVRLDRVEPEFSPIVRELAFGLALRARAMWTAAAAGGA